MNRTIAVVACVLGLFVAYRLFLKPMPYSKQPVEIPSTGPDSGARKKSSDPREVSGSRTLPVVTASQGSAVPTNLNVPQVPPVDPRVELIVDRKTNEHERLEALLAFNSSGATLEYQEDLDWMASLLRDPTAEDTIRHEAANLLQNHSYPLLTSNLLAVLSSPDEKARFRGFVVQHLWRRSYSAGPEEKAQILAALKTSLEDRDTPVRREAMLALVRLREKDGQNAALAWLTDPKESVNRDLAIRCVREMGLTNHLASVRASLSSEDEPARIQALVTLSEWGDMESKAAFENAAASTNTRLQRAGAAALRRLTGAMAPNP